MELILVLLVILILLVASAVLAALVHLLFWLIGGFIIGLIARFVVLGHTSLGITRTVLYGIAGSLLGGLVSHELGVGHFLDIVVSVACAALLITILHGRDQTPG